MHPIDVSVKRSFPMQIQKVDQQSKREQISLEARDIRKRRCENRSIFEELEKMSISLSSLSKPG
jgi:hypothetical protein